MQATGSVGAWLGGYGALLGADRAVFGLSPQKRGRTAVEACAVDPVAPRLEGGIGGR